MLVRDGREVPMREWARELLDSMTGICEVLDHGDPLRPYTQRAGRAGRQNRRRGAHAVRAADATSCTATGESFFDQALRMSTLHKDYFLDLYAPNEERLGEFAAEAAESLERQTRARDRQIRSLSIPTWRGILRSRSQIHAFTYSQHINFTRF